MKRIACSLAALCLLLCACTLVTGGAPLAQRLAGDWVTSEQQEGTGTVTTRMHIVDDHTFSGSLQVDGRTVWTFAGNWQLDDKNITWEYTDSSMILLQEDLAEVDTILRLDDATLELQSGRHGNVRTLTRVGNE
jgi:hypothetical protein